MKVVFRRTFTEEERVKMVMEALEYGSNCLVAKKYKLNINVLSRWLNNYRRYGETLMPKEPKVKKVIPNYKKEYEKLKKKIADKDLEIEVLRELIEKKKIAQKKELK